MQGESIRSIRVNVKVSCHHIEVNLSDLKGYEKQVIVQLIHETGNNRANKAVRDNQEVQCNQDNRYGKFSHVFKARNIFKLLKLLNI